jgi:hypothetical protein
VEFKGCGWRKQASCPIMRPVSTPVDPEQVGAASSQYCIAQMRDNHRLMSNVISRHRTALIAVSMEKGLLSHMRGKFKAIHAQVKPAEARTCFRYILSLLRPASR